MSVTNVIGENLVFSHVIMMVWVCGSDGIFILLLTVGLPLFQDGEDTRLSGRPVLQSLRSISPSCARCEERWARPGLLSPIHVLFPHDSASVLNHWDPAAWYSLGHEPFVQIGHITAQLVFRRKLVGRSNLLSLPGQHSEKAGPWRK